MIDDKKFVLPKFVESDNQYMKDLRKNLKLYLSFIEEFVSKKCYCNAQNISDALIDTLNNFYNGNVRLAFENMYSIIDCIIKNNEGFLVSFNELKGDCISDNIAFKARCSNPDACFSAIDMLHIPFVHREIVEGQRFSISGCPCIYLGKTTYVDWLEMAQPSFNTFFVSPIEIDGKIKVFNLAYTNWIEIYNFASKREIKELEKRALVFPLLLATSYVVKNGTGRKFKSEYIISQLLMSCMAKYKVSGVAYLSKRCDDHSPVYPINLCFAFLANKNTDKRFRVIPPVNMSIYLNLISKKFTSHICDFPDEYLKRPIFINGEAQPYNETFFYEFDRYLKRQFKDKFAKE